VHLLKRAMLCCKRQLSSNGLVSESKKKLLFWPYLSGEKSNNTALIFRRFRPTGGLAVVTSLRCMICY